MGSPTPEDLLQSLRALEAALTLAAPQIAAAFAERDALKAKQENCLPEALATVGRVTSTVAALVPVPRPASNPPTS
jgi:hypothetical protein